MTIEVNPKNASALSTIDKVDPKIVAWVSQLASNPKVISALSNPIKKAMLDQAIKRL
jgi:hypothetical protein